MILILSAEPAYFDRPLLSLCTFDQKEKE